MEEEQREPSFYEELVSIDIIDPILRLWKEDRIEAKIGEKLRLHNRHSLNRTWIFTKVCPDRNCGNWLGIYTEYYKILSPPCKQCWKVVYAPQTLKELMTVREMQAKMDLPSKCGLEKRDYTSGIGGYRAFWYCPFFDGLEGGRKRFAEVRRELELTFSPEWIRERQENGHLFLKRGCTELERDYGPSDQWDQYDFEGKFKLLETVWGRAPNLEREWSPMIYTIMKRWIEFAVAYGDPTVREYIGREPDSSLGVAAVKYHDSKHREDQFPLYIRPLNGTDKKLTKPAEDKSGTTEKKEEDLFGFEPTEG